MGDFGCFVWFEVGWIFEILWLTKPKSGVRGEIAFRLCEGFMGVLIRGCGIALDDLDEDRGGFFKSLLR